MNTAPSASSSLFADLGRRIGSALVLAAIGVLFLFLGGLPTALFLALVASIMLWELTRLVEKECALQPFAASLMILFGSLSVLSMNYSGTAFILLLLLGGILGAITNPRGIGPVCAVGYLLICCSTAAVIYLRAMPEGFWLVLWIVVCVIAADVGGYFFGRLFGGPKLWPVVSPKKTWSGALGGTGLTLLAAFAFGTAGDGDISAFLAFGLAIAVVALAGDLLESAAKRRFGVKDSSTILPGHGGLLDRFDGLSAVLILFFALSFVTDINALLDADYPAPAEIRSGL